MSTSAGEPEDTANGGWAFLMAWVAAVPFAIGCGALALMIVTGEAGAYGLGALMALGVMLLGVVVFVPAAALWVGHRLPRHRRPGAVAIVGLAALGATFAFLAVAVAGALGWLELPPDTWWPVVVAVTLLSVAAVVAADRSERLPAVVFALAWVALLATAGYRSWTDLEARVVWLDPTSVVQDSPGMVAFTATRSADYEVRYGAPSCGEGRLIATGHYAWRPDHPDSAHGKPEWVVLPLDVLPLRAGDVVRVCLRDGLAAGTASGESGGPGMGFWPKD